MKAIRTALSLLAITLLVAAPDALPHPSPATSTPQKKPDPAAEVNPFIGTLMTGSGDSGHTFPGAAMPFGMLQWSPENTRGLHTLPAAPGGYAYNTTRIRGFSLTHLSGTGCTGANGDIPFMPTTVPVTTSPSADRHDSRYASNFAHANEYATPGYYRVRLDNDVLVELAAGLRSGMARFAFPKHQPANLLVRVSDSEDGSSAAHIQVNRAAHAISGSVTSGYFCAYLSNGNRSIPNEHSYYTLYFIARFSQPFAAVGTWHDGSVHPGSISASGGTWNASTNSVAFGTGSGAWVGFKPGSDVYVQVGISYVSAADAKANLDTEIHAGTTLAQVRQRAHDTWNKALDRIAITGGTANERATFYTALYHALLQPNTFSDVNGTYRGFDQKIHHVSPGQKVQYANFSGWDVYRSQVQLLSWVFPRMASDLAQSLYNQARQSHGVWYRWTNESGGLTIMNGDPSDPAIASIVAFGATGFDVTGAYKSLKHAATHVTAADLNNEGCWYKTFRNNQCIGERPSLDLWMRLHYIPTHSHSGASAAETLEDVTADFALSQLAQHVSDAAGHKLFLTRSGYWRNLFNPNATAHGGYIQDRNKDGSWPKFTPGSDGGFVEGSAAQYLWMIPFDVHGLFAKLGGSATAAARLDALFRHADGSWAFTRSGPLHAEMDNEPSYLTPWLYDWAGRPWKTQETVRAAVNTLWKNAPGGVPGEDDLGETSSWYVWAALGMYPGIPGRAELMLASPLFPHIVIHRPDGDVTIDAPDAASKSPYVQALTLNGKPWNKPWLPAAFAKHGGALQFTLGARPDKNWGSKPADAPPSFPPPHAAAMTK